MPEYTLSLLFWILPVCIMGIMLARKDVLKKVQREAIAINLIVLSAVGCILDLLFAKLFFCFPNPHMTLGINICGIPIEEFIFYITGFWFIILLYVVNDELFLKKYNIDDQLYKTFARRVKKTIYFSLTIRSILLLIGLCAAFTTVKYFINPGKLIPGYILFLTLVAYVPYVVFWRLAKNFVNMQALTFTVVITTFISIIWEVTLALPRGYWNYNHEWMIGVFVRAWSALPVEAVTVWVFSSLIVLSYEYTKLMLHRKYENKLAVYQRNNYTSVKQPRK